MARTWIALAALGMAILLWDAVGYAEAQGDRPSSKGTSPQKNFRGQPGEDGNGNSGYQANEDPNTGQPAPGSPNPPPNNRGNNNNSSKGTRQGSKNEGR